MILGDPAQFAIMFEIVNKWNIDSSFSNGILTFFINGKIYPKGEAINVTLNFEIPNMKRNMSNICVDAQIFELPKYEAFIKIYSLRFPDDWDIAEDYRFDISPIAFSDNNCLIFAVSNGNMVRVLATSNLEYIVAESKYDLENIEIGETYITIDEWNDILSKLAI